MWPLTKNCIIFISKVVEFYKKLRSKTNLTKKLRFLIEMGKCMQIMMRLSIISFKNSDTTIYFLFIPNANKITFI
jgi:hypothetical protein